MEFNLIALLVRGLWQTGDSLDALIGLDDVELTSRLFVVNDVKPQNQKSEGFQYFEHIAAIISTCVSSFVWSAFHSC